MSADRVQQGVCEQCHKPGTLRQLDMCRGEELPAPRWICADCWLADRITPAERYRRMWEGRTARGEGSTR